MSNELANRNNNWMDFGNDDLFNHFAQSFFGHNWGFPNLVSKDVMKTDVSESDSAYTVIVDLPGLKKENISVDYNDGVLNIVAKQENNSEERNDKNEVIHSERYYGAYSRQYNLPNVDRDAVIAKYENGVLTLNLPKTSGTADTKPIEIQ